jgi:hypothetical protein
VAHLGDKKNAYRILVRKREEKKRPLRSPRHIKQCNIKMDLTEGGLEGVGWIYLLQARDKWQAVLKTVTNLRF